VRKTLDRKASQEFPDAKRLLGALANSRGHRHEENAARLVAASLTSPREVGAALLASADGYTPRATKMLEDARERLGTVEEIAAALAENLPQPKTGPSRSRRRRRRKKKGQPQTTPETQTAEPAEGEAAAAAEGEEPETAPKKRRRRRKKPTETEREAASDAKPEPEAPGAEPEAVPKPRRTRKKAPDVDAPAPHPADEAA
jgi:hypothetical protein